MIIQRIKMKKDDWLDLSLKLLSQNGVKALKIDFLCKEIKLTKGLTLENDPKNRKEIHKKIILDLSSRKTRRNAPKPF